MGREENQKGRRSVEKSSPMPGKALAPQKNTHDTKKSSVPMQIFLVHEPCSCGLLRPVKLQHAGRQCTTSETRRPLQDVRR
jgi:hypothetical protein